MRSLLTPTVVTSMLLVHFAASGDAWAQDVVPEDEPEGAHAALGPQPATEVPIAAVEASPPAQTEGPTPPPRPAPAPAVGRGAPEPPRKSRTGLGVALLAPGVLALGGGIALVAATAGESGGGGGIGPDFSGMPTALGGLMIFGGAGLSIAGGAVLATSPGGAPAPQAAFVMKPGWVGLEGAF